MTRGGILRAIWFDDAAAFERARFPGSMAFLGGARAGRLRFWCPCGCDTLRCATVNLWGDGDYDRDWNGSLSEPTLYQTFEFDCGWAGSLRLGYWGGGRLSAEERGLT